MDEKERQIRERLGIPINSDVAIIDLDEQQKPPETVTAGWTDTQIKNKSIEEIDLLISQNELALEAMEKSIATQQDNINGLKQVRWRKLQIGGN